jgi:hypothetical protein
MLAKAPTAKATMAKATMANDAPMPSPEARTAANNAEKPLVIFMTATSVHTLTPSWCGRASFIKPEQDP